MVHEQSSHTSDIEGESSLKEYVKFGLVLAGITVLSWLLATQYGSAGFMNWMRWFMGVFFIVFSLFKFLGYRTFPTMFAGYDILAKRFKPYAYIYPFIELVLGILYIGNLLPEIRDWLTLGVMTISAIGVFQELKRRTGIHCACLGNIIKLPLSTVSLVEDVGMGLMALALILHGL